MQATKKKIYKAWSPDDDKVICDFYDVMTNSQLAKELGRTKAAVISRMGKLKVKRALADDKLNPNPVTKTTVMCVRTWHTEGNSVAEIAELLMRPKKVIEDILKPDFKDYIDDSPALTEPADEGYTDLDEQEWA